MHRCQQILLRLNAKVLVENPQRVGGTFVQGSAGDQAFVRQGMTDVFANARWVKHRVQGALSRTAGAWLAQPWYTASAVV